MKPSKIVPKSSLFLCVKKAVYTLERRFKSERNGVIVESIRGRRVSAERIVLTAVTRNKLGKHRRDPQISAASSLIVRCAVRHSRGVHSLLSLTFSTIYVLSPIPGPDPCAPPIRFPRTSFVPAGDHCRPIHKNGLTLASHVAARISIRPSDTRSFLLRSSSLVTRRLHLWFLIPERRLDASSTWMPSLGFGERRISTIQLYNLNGSLSGSKIF